MKTTQKTTFASFYCMDCEEMHEGIGSRKLARIHAKTGHDVRLTETKDIRIFTPPLNDPMNNEDYVPEILQD